MTVAASRIAATLEVTLAFERIVDALLEFQRLTGAAPAESSIVARRAQLRDVVIQLINELDPAIRAAAEERCAAHLMRALPIVPCVSHETLAALMADALADYRHGLRQVPVSGVGRLV